MNVWRDYLNNLDSSKWLQAVFMIEEKRLLLELEKQNPDTPWNTVLDQMVSADFDNTTVTFTVHHDNPFMTGQVSRCLEYAIYQMHGVVVSVKIIREAK